MRRLLVVLRVALLLAGGLVLVSQLLWAEQPRSSRRLMVYAAEVDGNDSVRCAAITRNNVTLLQVRGGKPFQVVVQNSYRGAPERVLIALTDGEVHPVTDLRLEYTCSFLILYYGLVIAEYPGDVIETARIEMHPAWRKEDAGSIPDERPLLKKPASDDKRIQHEIGTWWDTFVVPQERAVCRETGQPSQFDEPETANAQK